MKAYPVATICGTMKLYEDMLTVAQELTRQGYIVLAPFVTKGDGSLRNPTPITDEELDRMHLAKIDQADVVVFVTQERRFVWGDRTGSSLLYFGESTTAELKYARSLGKVIRLVRCRRRDYRDDLIWQDDDGRARVVGLVWMGDTRPALLMAPRVQPDGNNRHADHAVGGNVRELCDGFNRARRRYLKGEQS